jgi:hypothetical protein
MMPVIYMSHPVHGAKVANMELEALEDEKKGWVRYALDAPVEEEAAPIANELEIKRRGRPSSKAA